MAKSTIQSPLQLWQQSLHRKVLAEFAEGGSVFPYSRNRQYVKPNAGRYNTQLLPEDETAFRQWLQDNLVPFDPNAGVTDYDMRGFWKGLTSGDPHAQSAVDPNDQRLHYTDWWKTPFHDTFSNGSQWAMPDAPHWTDDDKLVDKDGNILFDDRAGRGE